MFHFERHHEKLAPRYIFFFRLIRNFTAASLVIGSTLALGAYGFMFFEQLSLIDSIHNSTRIVAGMEPAHSASDDVGKWFEIVYHMIARFIVVIATALFLAPMLHRMLHRFHIKK